MLFCVADCVADRIRFAIPQATEWQHVGNQIDAAFNAARGGFTGALPQPLINVEAASEGDLIEMERWFSQNGTGADVVAIREFLRIVRDEPAQPLAITIVNAEQVGATPKVLTVKRDDSGKLSGAVSQPKRPALYPGEP